MNATPRMYYLDRLRAFLTMLVIAHHAAIAYGAGGSWYFEDVDKTEITVSMVLLTMFTAVNQSFFMGLFFFLSGYFTPSSYDRKGPARFLADRFVRLGVPLAAFHFALGPLVEFIAGRTGYDRFGAYYRAEVLSFRSDHFGPLWFVETLLYFAILYAGWRLFAARRSRSAGARVAAAESVAATASLPAPSDRALLAAAVGLGLIAFAVRLVYPTGTDVLGMQLGYFPMYVALFAAGIAAKRSGWLDRLDPALTRRWSIVSLAAIPVLPIALVATGALEGNMTFAGGMNAQAFVYAMWEPFVGFGIILYLLRRFALRDKPPTALQRARNDAAFGAYVIHPLIVVAASLTLVGVPLHPALKFALVAAASIPLCFAAAWLLRRVPGADRIL
ncbi:acyltransferase [Paenibacillus antri]|uniref:Acyltransferase n=1 Tax=Paenibacillus antri TaxID=2582848 RepID=A0A5R9GAI8_9BACL|nr:acyltransferase family protein [Paenibacillus antri]TLS52079.1 acyltransferase [Paenibacillus antri]